MKQKIISTSLEGFLKNGIRKMTVQKLVAPLGMSTKTVYKYFTNKEALLRACLIVHYSRLLSQASTAIASNTNPAVSLENIWKQAVQADFGVNHRFYQDLNHYYPVLQDEILKTQGRKLEKALLRLIKKGVEEGFFRSQLDPRVILQAMMVMYRSLTRTVDFSNFELSPEELATQTVQVYLRGICTEKGLNQLSS